MGVAELLGPHGKCRQEPQAAEEVATPLPEPLTPAVGAPTPLPPAAKLLPLTHTVIFWGFFLAPEGAAHPPSLQGPAHTMSELESVPLQRPAQSCSPKGPGL